MKRSPEIGIGIYQFEWREDRIDVVEWNEPPISTKQWVQILPEAESFLSKYKTFFLEGTCNEDIRVVPVEDAAFEWFSTSG